MIITVIGNTSRNIGIGSAADFALAGHEVRLALFDEQLPQFEQARRAGGFQVEGQSSQLVSGTTGFAKLRIDAISKEMLDASEVIVLDIAMPELAARFERLIHALPRDVVAHAQSYGSWASALLTTKLAEADRRDVIATDARAPTITVKHQNGTITTGAIRRGLELATIPIARAPDAIDRLKGLFMDIAPATSVLQTGLENINLMVHPAMSLLGIGMFERAEQDGQEISFYRDANVPSAGLLGDLLDSERAAVCAAYGVQHRSLPATLQVTYGANGDTSHESVKSCKPYQSAPPSNASIWREWARDDVPFGVVPLVLLAEQAGLKTPLHRAAAEIFGALLRFDPWAGPSLAGLGLEGSPDDVVRKVRGH